jgi:hypothetical protein
METRWNGQPAGEYAVSRYNELKSVIKEQGHKVRETIGEFAGNPTDRYHASGITLKDEFRITRGEVDDNPKSDDFIKTMKDQLHPAGEKGVVSKVTMEEFKERMFHKTPVVTFNYMEVLSYADGTRMTSSLLDHFNARTGERIPPNE